MNKISLKIRIIFNDWEQYKKEIDDLKKYENLFLFPIKLKLDFSKFKKVDNKSKQQLQNMRELLEFSLKKINDKDVRKMLDNGFKEVGLL